MFGMKTAQLLLAGVAAALSISDEMVRCLELTLMHMVPALMRLYNAASAGGHAVVLEVVQPALASLEVMLQAGALLICWCCDCLLWFLSPGT